MQKIYWKRGKKMNADKEKLYELLEDIKKIIEQNETEDGNFRFDIVRACVALDFAKTEISKTIKD